MTFLRLHVIRTFKTSTRVILWAAICYSILNSLLKSASVPLKGAIPMAVAFTVILWMSLTPIYQEARRLLNLVGSQLLGIQTLDAVRSRRSGTREKHLIARPPGMTLLLIVDFLYSEKTVELTFRPLLGEWHSEYFKALNGSRLAKARWICVRYYWGFLKAMVLDRILEIIKFFTSLFK